MLVPLFPRIVASKAVYALSVVDYTIANRVAEDVSTLVDFAYAHDVPQLAIGSVHLLQFLDSLGGNLILLVCYIVNHTV